MTTASEPRAPGARRGPRRHVSPAALAVILAMAQSAAVAQVATPAAAPAGVPPPGTDAGSPRAAVRDYLDSCRAGRWDDAARSLELTGVPDGRGRVLARRLKAVLDRHLWIDLGTVSGDATGDLDDGFPPEVEELGSVPGPGGQHEAVRLARVTWDGKPRWLFSAATVGRVDVWYPALGEAPLLEWIPEPLLRPGPLQLLWWQWLALPLLVLVAWAAGRLLSAVSRALLGRMAARTDPEWDEALVRRLGGPLTIGWGVVAARLLVIPLHLYAPAQQAVSRVLESAFLGALFWALWRSVDVARDLVGASPWAKARATSRTLVPLGARSAKAVVLVVGVVTVVSELGYPVGSLIAGLGVGGLAVALAAQKTVENLFGAFALGVDQPFREGDFVKVGDVQGNVEAIGLRSTRIRTLERTVVSIPNGKLGDMVIETFAARDRIRMACILGLVHGTGAVELRAIVAAIEGVLGAHPKVLAEDRSVRVLAIAAGSIDVEVVAWFRTTDGAEFALLRHEVLLGILQAVADAGGTFADRSRTLLAPPAPAAPPAGRPAGS